MDIKEKVELTNHLAAHIFVIMTDWIQLEVLVYQYNILSTSVVNLKCQGKGHQHKSQYGSRLYWGKRQRRQWSCTEVKAGKSLYFVTRVRGNHRLQSTQDNYMYRGNKPIFIMQQWYLTFLLARVRQSQLFQFSQGYIRRAFWRTHG